MDQVRLGLPAAPSGFSSPGSSFPNRPPPSPRPPGGHVRLFIARPIFSKPAANCVVNAAESFTVDDFFPLLSARSSAIKLLLKYQYFLSVVCLTPPRQDSGWHYPRQPVPMPGKRLHPFNHHHKFVCLETALPFTFSDGNACTIDPTETIVHT